MPMETPTPVLDPPTRPQHETEAAPPPPVTLTDRAAKEVHRIIANKQIPREMGLRIGVKGGGCSGMSYILGFDKEREHDITFEITEGVQAVMDKRHGLYLLGTAIDYHDGLDARGFVFENPNATQTCGCGSSFAA